MTTVEEWRAELERLRFLPGHSGVWSNYWRAWLDRNRTGPARRPLETSRTVRLLKPAERVAMNEGRPLEPGSQVLRAGANRWYVIQPEPRTNRQPRVTRVY